MTTCFLFDRGNDRRGVSSVVFTAPNHAEFSRAATIEESRDGVAWEQADSTQIQRFRSGDPQLSMSFDENNARYWRVSVANKNDQPVAGLTPVLRGPEHWLVFPVRAGERYTIVDGQTEDAPVYDLQTRLTHDDWTTVGAASITAAVALPPAPGRPGYVWPKIAFRHWFEVVLGAVVLGLAVTASRATLRPKG